MKKILLVLFLVIFVLTGCVLFDIYAIGDIGSGGGVVFDTDDNEYLEYILLKDNKNWEDADETAGNYTGGGYYNWRLPTRSELDDIYENLYKSGIIIEATHSYYWSSSDTGTNGKAWCQRFSDGNKSTDHKTEKNSVLVVRGWF